MSNQELLARAKAELEELEKKLGFLIEETGKAWGDKLWMYAPDKFWKIESKDMAKLGSIGEEIQSVQSKIKAKKDRIAFLEFLEQRKEVVQPKINTKKSESLENFATED